MRGRIENVSRLQTWANLKGLSQESLEMAGRLKTGPLHRLLYKFRGNPLEATSLTPGC